MWYANRIGETLDVHEGDAWSILFACTNRDDDPRYILKTDCEECPGKHDGMRATRVRVTGCTVPGDWYAERIGEVFEVYEVRGYVLKEDYDVDRCYILEGDCEVVEGDCEVVADQHPTQPLYEDENGTIRFKANAIVRFLLDAGPFNLDQLAYMPFKDEDWVQLAQLIGYSLSGFGELSYVSEEDYKRGISDGCESTAPPFHSLD